MRVEILISLVICISLSNSKSVSEFRIFNGYGATKGQFPYQASLRSKHNNKHNCGAAILNNRFLLTAAHCCLYSYSKPAYVSVVVGSLHRSIGGIAMDVDKITLHEAFEPSIGQNDIALIRTAKQIKFNNQIQPIALPSENVIGGKPLIASGWGEDGDSGYNILQYVEVQTLNRSECKKHYNSKLGLYYISNSNVCTIGKDNDGPCKGDSGMTYMKLMNSIKFYIFTSNKSLYIANVGGPLADLTDSNHRTLVGVVSWGGAVIFLAYLLFRTKLINWFNLFFSVVKENHLYILEFIHFDIGFENKYKNKLLICIK